MAHWNPTAANDLMAFAANNGLTPLVVNFQDHVDLWADGLHVHTNASFPFGNYQAEVTADAGQVHRIQFDS